MHLLHILALFFCIGRKITCDLMCCSCAVHLYYCVAASPAASLGGKKFEVAGDERRIEGRRGGG